MTALRSAAALLMVVAVLAVGVAAWETLVRSRPAPPEPPPVPTLQIAGSDVPSAATPPVRVNLTPTAAKRLAIAIDGPYTMQAVTGARVLVRGDRLAACEVTATATGLKIGATTYPAERIELVPERSPAIWVDDHQYRGRVRLYRQPGGTVLAVNVLPLEEYVASVIDSEMPAAFPPAARQAQAIVARTYALSHVRAAHPLFDLYATTRSQRYLGYQYRDASGRRLAGESDNSRRIARQTRGIVCTYQGRLFCTYYSAVCGGQTTPGPTVFADAAPPLRSVPCRWCREAELYRWTIRVPRAGLSDAVRRALRSHGQSFGTLRSITHRTADGTEPFQVSDGRHTHDLSGTDLRQALSSASLPSPHFTVRMDAKTATIDGRGHGHGVGLCQWGARGQALAGRSALDILRHYYPGADIVRLK